MSHTPGPWSADPWSEGHPNGVGYSIRPHRKEDGGMTGWQLAYVSGKHDAGLHHEYGSSAKDDARLIAAAPDLLDALEVLLVFAKPHFSDETQRIVVEKARAAINKARGQ